ncbi:MAG: hypothetical protein L0Y72_22050 [Gemmataceae bacterium]|nr:hypothetical protein [Gemmataceae bacterium]MCI0741725.1 hypothetical protein [Gemmataceae bacterium]
MHWIFIVLASAVGLLVLAAVLILIVGRFLPERYEAQVIVEFDRNPEDIWNALMNVPQNPMTGRMLKRLEPLPDVNGLPSWVEDIGSTKLVATTEQADKPRLLRRRLADQVVPMTADWEMRLEELPAGCRMTAASVTVVRKGTWHVPFFRFMLKVTGNGKSQLRGFCKRLAGNLGTRARFV